jgi:hypothetical protein
MCKNNTKLIYLTFIHCTNEFEKHKQFFPSENYNRTFHNKNTKKHKVVFCVRCSILILLIKSVRCSIHSL